jgi:hypothetical protein
VDLDRLMTALNGAIVATLRSPLHVVLDRALMLVTVTGRRSGQRYTIPVGYQMDGDRVVVLVSKARRKNWWRNYLEARPVEVHLRGIERRGIACVIPAGSESFFAAVENTLERMPWLGPQFSVRYRRGTALSAADREVLAREVAAVEFRLERA